MSSAKQETEITPQWVCYTIVLSVSLLHLQAQVNTTHILCLTVRLFDFCSTAQDILAWFMALAVKYNLFFLC